MKKSNRYSNVLVTGSIAFDEIMDFPSEFQKYIDPTKLHQLNVSFVVDKLEKQIGGIGTNIVYNLCLLKNFKNVVLLSSVGKDGKQIIDWLKKNKINTKSILIDKDLYTATGKVITDKKGNQIWGFYYGALIKSKDIDLTQYVKRGSLLIITSTHPNGFLKHQKQAIKLKLDYFYDPGPTLSWIETEDLQEGVKYCKWLIGNDYEIGRVLQTLQTSIVDLTKQNIAVITTLGDQGVQYTDSENNFLVPAFKVKNIIDPTGAGDAWRAGFVSGILQGETILRSLKIGNALASFAVEKYGTVNHKPTKQDVFKRAKSL